MDPSDSFYEYDIGLEPTFSNQKPVPVSLIYQTHSNDDSLGFSDIAPYNEESIDIQQYLHLGNTPPNGDDLLKQFGAYSSSPPITVNVGVRPNCNTNNSANTSTTSSSTLSQGFARVSLSQSNSNTSSIQQPSIVHANQPSTAPNPESPFNIKKEFDERSVPDFEETSMPPGEEQNNMIAKGDPGNHIGGQQTYILPQPYQPGDDVVTTSSSVESLVGHTLNMQEVLDSVESTPLESVVKNAKKRQRNRPDKDSSEYKNKRQRNNLAVRKSREKSKVRNYDLQSKVQTLQTENERLNKKVELLSKELTVLRSLFTTVKPSTGQ